MIDLHTHVLPGIDDGPPTMEGSVDLARAAEAAGTTTLVATPHVTWDIPNDAAGVAAGVEATQRAIDEAGVGLRVRTGGELAISRAAELDDDELRGLRLGGGEWLLAECPLSPVAAGFDGILMHLQQRGHRILLAHPERCPALQRAPDKLAELVAAGMLTQITAGSLNGVFGQTVRRFTLELLEAGIVHAVASDAHDAVRRGPDMTGGLRAGEEELPGLLDHARWLTVDVPAAILDGGPVPRPPGPPPQRRRRGLGALLSRGGRSR